MTNKNLKKMFDKKFNKKILKEQILIKDELDNKNFKLVMSVLVTSICLFTFISFIIIGNNSVLDSKPNDNKNIINETNNNSNIQINELKSIDIITEESNITDGLNYYMIPYFEELNNLDIPDDFDNEDYHDIKFVKNEDGEYYCNNYIFSYFNTTNNRRINIYLSKEYIPISKYSFDEGRALISKINDIEFKMFNYDNIYIIRLIYKKINFEIETIDLSKEEVVKLLNSLIK